MNVWNPAFGADIVDVVLDDVCEGADLGVIKLSEVFCDVVVEIYFDIGVFGLVGVAAGGAVVPVPAIGRDNCLPVGKFRAVYYGSTGRFDE